MFGMLILVFVLFFGMPSMGVSAGGTVYHVPNKVFNAEVKLNEARAYVNRFRFDREDGFNQMRVRFKQIQDVTMLDEVAKDNMGWESTDEQAEQYMTQATNWDHYLFGKADVELKDLNQAFLKSLEDSKQDLDSMSGREAAQKYLEFSRKARGFSAQNMKDVLESWGLDMEEYLNMKGRELRVRSYLDFLQSQVKTSRVIAEDELRLSELKWSFDYALIGNDHAAAPAPASDADAEAYAKTHEGQIDTYYKTNILDYSKSKLAFTRVSVRYKSEAEAAKARKKLEDAYAQVKAGGDPSEVGEKLSKTGVKLSVYPQGNKTRKNTASELFEMGLKMELNQLSEIQDPSAKFKGAVKPTSGTYYFIRLDKKELGEEKTLADVKTEIAKILISQEKRLESAKAIANTLRAKVVAGEKLSAVIDAHNAQRGEGSTLKAITLTESGDVTIDGLVSNRLGNVGNHPIAASQLLNEIININDKTPAPTIMKIGDQWAVFALKQRSEPEVDKNIDRALADAQREARSEFFGRAWSSFVLTGDQSPILIQLVPFQILARLSGELAQGEGFIDEIIETKYRKYVEEAPEVTRFLSTADQG